MTASLGLGVGTLRVGKLGVGRGDTACRQAWGWAWEGGLRGGGWGKGGAWGRRGFSGGGMGGFCPPPSRGQGFDARGGRGEGFALGMGREKMGPRMREDTERGRASSRGEGWVSACARTRDGARGKGRERMGPRIREDTERGRVCPPSSRGQGFDARTTGWGGFVPRLRGGRVSTREGREKMGWRWG